MRFLLDTNIVSDLVRNPRGRAAQRVAPRLTSQLEAVLDVMEILPLALPVDREYGRLRAQLERDGQPIGGNDLLIAAQNVVLGLTLVTDNQRNFSQIAELSGENWLR